MYLLKIDTFRSISQKFDHFSNYKFRAGSFSKQLAAQVSGIFNLFSIWHIAYANKGMGRERSF